jgi:hypothetical protein
MNAKEGEFDLTPASILRRFDEWGYAHMVARSGVDALSIGQQLSMHLPRLTAEEIASPDIVLDEACRLANRLCLLRREYQSEITPIAAPTLRSMRAEVIDPSIAQIIFDRYHYLLSHRQDSLSLGLRANSTLKWPFAIACLSPFDLENLSSGLPNLQQREAVLVLSRVFAFPWAPRNSISYLLKQVRSYIRYAFPLVTRLVTYVNPSLGFRGTSYRADNWSQVGREVDTRYLYVDGNYRTDRSLAIEYGTASIPVLRSRLGERLQISRYALKPLSVLTRSVRKGGLIREASLSFSRWCAIGSYSPDSDNSLDVAPTAREAERLTG